MLLRASPFFGTKIIYTVSLTTEILLISLSSFNFFKCFQAAVGNVFQKWPQNCASLYIEEVMAV